MAGVLGSCGLAHGHRGSSDLLLPRRHTAESLLVPHHLVKLGWIVQHPFVDAPPACSGMLAVVVEARLLVRAPEAAIRVAVLGEESIREPHCTRPTEPVLATCRPEVGAIHSVADDLAVIRVHAKLRIVVGSVRIRPSR